MTQGGGCLYCELFALLNYLYADVACPVRYSLARRIQPHTSHNGLCWVQRS